MADYDQPEFVAKRVRYFDGQFLKDQDFIDEQKYHLDRQRRANRFLHVAGILDGLTLTTPAAGRVSVAPGTALDRQGRQIVLGHEASVPLGDHYGQTVDLVILYDEQEADQAQAGSAGFTRFHEDPRLLVVGGEDTRPADAMALGRLIVDANGTVTILETVRVYAGWRFPANHRDVEQWPALRAQDTERIALTGALSVSGNVGVGTATPGAKLEVVGEGGASVDLLVNGRLQSNNNDGGLLIGSDRFVGGHSTNQVGLWNNDAWRLSVQADGKVGIGTLTPQARLEVVGEGGLNVDLVVNGRLQSNNNDGGLMVGSDRFVGGHSTNQVGFWNNAWRLSVQADGKVGIGTITPGATLHVNGSFAVAPGQSVSGIPVIEFRSQTQRFANHSGSPGVLNYSFAFSRPVVRAEAMLQSWYLQYDNGREYVHQLGVYCNPMLIAGNTASVAVTFQLRDNTGNFDDPYEGFATIVVIAQLSQTV